MKVKFCMSKSNKWKLSCIWHLNTQSVTKYASGAETQDLRRRTLNSFCECLMRKAMPLLSFSMFPCRSLAITFNMKNMDKQIKENWICQDLLDWKQLGGFKTINHRSLHFWARWCVEQTLWLDWLQTSCWLADCVPCGTASPRATSTGCDWLVGATWKAAGRPQSGAPCQAHLSYSPYHQSEWVLDTADKKIVTGGKWITTMFFGRVWWNTKDLCKGQPTPPIFRCTW